MEQNQAVMESDSPTSTTIGSAPCRSLNRIQTWLFLTVYSTQCVFQTSARELCGGGGVLLSTEDHGTELALNSAQHAVTHNLFEFFVSPWGS